MAASIYEDFKQGHSLGSGDRLAASLTPIAPAEYPDRLRAFYHSGSGDVPDLHRTLFRNHKLKLPKQEQAAWVDIYTAYWKAAGELVKLDDGTEGASWSKVFDAWKATANALIRGYSTSSLQAWTLPCLYVIGKYLRLFAMRADAEQPSQESIGFNDDLQDDVVADFEKSAKLEEAARIMNRMFTLCLSDRAPIEDSRKWGIYSTTNLLFKTYFKLNSVGLSKNLLRALNASSADTPELEAFPKSHIVPFEYYVGVIHFLDEKYAEAEQHLTYAWKMCHRDAFKNKELILTYLVPCHIVTTHTLPSKGLLAPFPRLEKLFRPLCDCIRKGDLVGFDAAMSAGEEEFVKRRIYLPLERGRDIALRNLFRRVFIAGGFDESKNGQPPIRRTRVPVAEFGAAMRIGTHADTKSRIDMDEIECLLSNLIYKGLMKGYISRERSMVVLSKGGTAFPGTGV
ncbi:hypothetical protein ASPZODRAFT_131358 [Penicilliopsis zonata CBS 506.65]|uniref:Protein CSN12 homolog n=1 Tax=Penicilliopsis zonata CBS 506.65 TaxID=1073090 RepID=A0A1L9SKQ7_9EURO|nr:hypothetical protein ASPZODRAFT_131358 [Penicilliopsis zonata CBS 506.65]OJJ47788.1 hypothetical protein ASPZODRAFT_131358 [Penicilliopsis zonata CBS 506.65]